jgi:hypothetical protein
MEENTHIFNAYPSAFRWTIFLMMPPHITATTNHSDQFLGSGGLWKQREKPIETQRRNKKNKKTKTPHKKSE